MGVPCLRMVLLMLATLPLAGTVAAATDWPAQRARFNELAASTDLESARRAFLDLLWQANGGLDHAAGSEAADFFRARVEDALRIAEAPADVARAWYYEAAWRQRLDADPAAVGAAWEQAASDALAAELLPTALWNHAQWLEGSRPAAALAVYRDLGGRFPDSEHTGPAAARIAAILQPELALRAPFAFLPETEAHIELHTRNIERVRLRVDRIADPPGYTTGASPVEPMPDPAPAASAATPAKAPVEAGLAVPPAEPAAAAPPATPANDPAKAPAEAGLAAPPAEPATAAPPPPPPAAVVEWAVEVDHAGDPHTGQARRLPMPAMLPPGFYRIRAQAGDLIAETTLLVSDLMLLTRLAPGSLAAWVVHAESGAPAPQATLSLCLRRAGAWRQVVAQADATGLAQFNWEADGDDALVLWAVRDGHVARWDPGPPPSAQPQPRLIGLDVAVPVLAPGGGNAWRVRFAPRPTGPVTSRVLDPEGRVVWEETAPSSRHGTLQGTITSTDGWPAGAYRWEAAWDGGRAGRTLFELRADTSDAQAPALQLTASRRLLPLGGSVVVSLRAASGVPARGLAGTLALVRERWRALYVHRKRGTEITGEAYRELPDRALLSSSQADYVLREEGFITEQIWQRELSLPAGSWAEELSFAEAGYYRLIWTPADTAWAAAGAEVPIWVHAGEEGATPGFRPAGISLVHDRTRPAGALAADLLLGTPEAAQHIWLSHGGQAPQSSAVLRCATRSRLYRLPLPDAATGSIWIEAAHTRAGRWWATRSRLLPEREENGLRLQLDGLDPLGQPGEEMVLRWQVTDTEGDPVAAETVFVWRPAGGEEPSDIAVAPWRSGASVETLPFFDPLSGRGLAGTIITENGEQERAAGPGGHSPNLAASGWRLAVSLPDDDERTITLTMPPTPGAWDLLVIATDGSGRRATRRVPVTVVAGERARWNLPGWLRAGDEALFTATFETTAPGTSMEGWRLQLEGPADIVTDPDSAEPSQDRRSWLLAARDAGELRARLEDAGGAAMLEGRLDVLPLRERTSCLVRAGTGAYGPAGIVLAWWRGLDDGASLPLDAAAWLIGARALREAWRGVAGIAADARFPWVEDARAWQRRRDLLLARQNASGGWGWWDGAPDDALPTAWIVWALTGQEAGADDATRAAIELGRQALLRQLAGARDPWLQAWILHALAQRFEADPAARPSRPEIRVFIDWIRMVDAQHPLTAAMLAPFAHYLNLDEECRLLAARLRAVPAPGDNQPPAPWNHPLLQEALMLRARCLLEPESVSPDALTELLTGRIWRTGMHPFLRAPVAVALAEVLAQTDVMATDTRFELLVESWQPVPVAGLATRMRIRRQTPTLLRGPVDVTIDWSPDQRLRPGDTISKTLTVDLPEAVVAVELRLPWTAACGEMRQPVIRAGDGSPPEFAYKAERVSGAWLVRAPNWPAGAWQVSWEGQVSHTGSFRFPPPAWRSLGQGEWRDAGHAEILLVRAAVAEAVTPAAAGVQK